MEVLNTSILKPKIRKTYKTKNKGDFVFYSEDTICSFGKTGIPKSLGFSLSENEIILRELGYIIMNEVVSHNQGFDLPEKIGRIKVIGQRRRSTNKLKSQQYQKKIWNTNSHTDGIVFKSTMDFTSKWRYIIFKRFKSSFGLRAAIKEKVTKDYMIFSIVAPAYESVRVIKSNTTLKLK